MSIFEWMVSCAEPKTIGLYPWETTPKLIWEKPYFFRLHLTLAAAATCPLFSRFIFVKIAGFSTTTAGSSEHVLPFKISYPTNVGGVCLWSRLSLRESHPWSSWDILIQPNKWFSYWKFLDSQRPRKKDHYQKPTYSFVNCRSKTWILIVVKSTPLCVKRVDWWAYLWLEPGIEKPTPFGHYSGSRPMCSACFS